MSKEIKQWFKVVEIADMVGYSKVSVYNKIKTFNSDILKDLQKKEKGITYFNLEAVEIIRAAFNQDNFSNVDIDHEETAEDNTPNNEYINLYITELQNEIEFLKGQIHTKDDLINKHVKLVENEQVLRREEQQAISLLEEARSREIDEKLMTWRNEHFSKDIKENKKGLFKKLFRKNM